MVNIMLGLFKNISLTKLVIIVCSTLLLSLILAIIIGVVCAALFSFIDTPCWLVIILFYVITVLLSIILK